MACAGFTCSKNALIALNVMYIIVGFILIAVAAYGQKSNLVSSISIIGGIIACGVFLLLVSLLGILGAVKHHQVVLFFYMVVLFVLFLIQFSVACACLAMNDSQQRSLTEAGWHHADDELKSEVQKWFGCCGYNKDTLGSNDTMKHPSCVSIPKCCPGQTPETCCQGNATICDCETCEKHLVDAVHAGLKASGGIGLFFSFTEIVGIVITYRYRGMAHDIIS